MEKREAAIGFELAQGLADRRNGPAEFSRCCRKGAMLCYQNECRKVLDEIRMHSNYPNKFYNIFHIIRKHLDC